MKPIILFRDRVSLILLFCSIAFFSCGNNKEANKSSKQPLDKIVLKSLDDSVSAEIKTDGGAFFYRVLFRDREIITWSELGLLLNGEVIGKNVQVLKMKDTIRDESFAWRLGEQDTIKNKFHQYVLECKDGNMRFDLEWRLYHGSVAFRYRVPSQRGLHEIRLTKELTSFNFDRPFTIYQYNQESEYTAIRIDSLNDSCDLPATLSSGGDNFVIVGEADNESYTKGELVKGDVSNSLTITFPHDSVVSFKGHFRTPWRTISYSNTAIGLHEFSDLNLKLVKPVKEEIPDWIRPGKLIRSQLNTVSGIRCVDFAASHQFQYVLFDAGWYGKEFNSTSDPRTYIKDIDLPRIIRYGKEKGIGIILYVNYIGLRNHLDEILPLYKEWGVAGLKFGFVDGLSQKGIKWLVTAVKKATDAGFIVDVHDNYKPTGLSRKYPAWLTQEGIRGDENSPDAFHTTVLPFTRFLAGPADFTFCYPNSKNSFSHNLKVSMAQQLALTVIYFSPLQAIFWYGKPEDYTNEEEIEFFKFVPTVWNETHYLAGEIGKNISVARRSGETWFVGSASGMKDWKDSLRLDFLDSDRDYQAVIYEDNPADGIQKRFLKVKKGEVLPINIKAKGGQAATISPL